MISNKDLKTKKVACMLFHFYIPLTIVGFGLELSNCGFCFRMSLRRDLSGKTPLEANIKKFRVMHVIDSLMCYSNGVSM